MSEVSSYNQSSSSRYLLRAPPPPISAHPQSRTERNSDAQLGQLSSPPSSETHSLLALLPLKSFLLASCQLFRGGVWSDQKMANWRQPQARGRGAATSQKQGQTSLYASIPLCLYANLSLQIYCLPTARGKRQEQKSIT